MAGRISQWLKSRLLVPGTFVCTYSIIAPRAYLQCDDVASCSVLSVVKVHVSAVMRSVPFEWGSDMLQSGLVRTPAVDDIV